jgi:hypothetical protein
MRRSIWSLQAIDRRQVELNRALQRCVQHRTAAAGVAALRAAIVFIDAREPVTPLPDWRELVVRRQRPTPPTHI